MNGVIVQWVFECLFVVDLVVWCCIDVVVFEREFVEVVYGVCVCCDCLCFECFEVWILCWVEFFWYDVVKVVFEIDVID